MNDMYKVWIAGANGQIGRAINQEADPLEMEIFDTDKDELDISDIDEVLRFGDMSRPDVIINCAGITDVALCEEQPELAYKVNALGARNLSVAARRLHAKMIHLSTDDVFDGKTKKPYMEFDDTNPLTVYGRSKRAGENYVKEFTNTHFIIRSSWIYGEGKNYVNHLLELAKTQKEIAANDKEFGSPTSARELARFIIHLLKTNEYGLYHATCNGVCSRFDLAKEVFAFTGQDIKIVPGTDESNKIERPAYAVLENFILNITGVYEMADWHTALKEYLGGTYEKRA